MSDNITIGAYSLDDYAQSEDHVKDIKRCGIDIMIGVPNKKELLDSFYKHGVGAVVGGVVPGWFGGKGENAGTMESTRTLEMYDEAAKSFVDHRAVWGIAIGDEPSMLDFPHFGKVFERVNALFKNQMPYLNIYPSYAMLATNTMKEREEQLGTKNYAEYIESYCKNVPSDYIGFDFYPYSDNIEAFLSDLDIVSKACKRYGRSMRTVLQVNSHIPDIWTSENRLRFQAYAAMAFGTNWIIWACYTSGWWYNQVIDEKGNKTQQYDKLRRVNAEIKYLGEKYMRYSHAATHMIEGEKSLDAGSICDLHAQNGQKLIVGERRNENGIALMICAADDPYDESYTEFKINFRCASRNIRACSGSGELLATTDGDGISSITVHSCAGVLLTVQEKDVF